MIQQRPSIPAVSLLGVAYADGSMLERDLGTHHRGAPGLTEETDSVVVVVSEETSTMSAAAGAKLWRDISVSQLRDVLTGGEPHAVIEGERAAGRA